jgi:DNA-binding transcriptional MerR regulator
MLQKDISAIEEKRRVLEQIVEIAKSIEHMQNSLDSVLILGVASKEMPEGALDLYSSLSENLRNLPVNKIKEYLVNLERIIKNQLEKILHFSGIDFASDEAIEILYLASDDSEQSPIQLLEEFKRTAQTAVSLRVLLRKRGVATPGSGLPVPAEMIHQQIENLDVQEQQQRGRIKHKIVEMQDDIGRMIDNPGYPDSMKQLLQEVRANLDNDLQNIDKGAPLSALSFVSDADELSGLQESPAEEISLPTQPLETDKAGFSAAASRWLNSPWDVSWNQLKKQS